ncbi:MAG TPA: RidA family protein [Burkholderiaceae bacterium]|nr:RidA family protein [Burkholderiaceae bacterium]HRA62227.1 RidA family protein [Burkholderiaceae bacterium]
MSSSITRTHTTSRMSKIVRHGDLVYLCGQTSGGTDIADVAGQTSEVLRRIDRLLKEAGTDKSKLLTALIHLRNISDFAAMNAVWDVWLPEGAAPARTTVQSALASDSLLVEITVVAAV